MSNIIRLKIDVTKIDKARLYKGAKGVYLDAAAIPTKDSQYGDTHVIIQDVSKEEREQGVKGGIIGNAKELVKEAPREQQRQAAAQDVREDDMQDDEIPF